VRRVATLENGNQPSLRDEKIVIRLSSPALKRRAKVMLPLRGAITAQEVT